MGLGGTRKKQVIGRDPRNTGWANDSARFGHQYLQRQGWKPGKGLGSSQASRAISSNVTVAAKFDNSGIGATPEHAQSWSGLGEFNAIFGRIHNDPNAFGARQDPAPILEEDDKGLKSKSLARRFVRGGSYASEFERIRLSNQNPRKRTRNDSGSDENQSVEARDRSGYDETRSKRKEAKRIEKAQRKLERKALKRARKEQKSDKNDPQDTEKDGSDSVQESSQGSLVSRESTSSPNPRNMARSRYLESKRASRTDQRALSAILGIAS